MSFTIKSKSIPQCCGACPCFHAETPMYCQAVKADKNKKIVAPYKEGRPKWCPIMEEEEEKEILIEAFVETCKYLQKVGPSQFIEDDTQDYLNQVKACAGSNTYKDGWKQCANYFNDKVRNQ